MPYSRPDSMQHDDGDGEQTNIRRWIVNLDQASRMFDHHDSDAVPEEPETKIRSVTDEELAVLEDEINEK